MDESRFGKRDLRGYWKPLRKQKPPPLFVWPLAPLRLAKWIFGFPGYLYPWNLFYLVVAMVIWFFLTPGTSTLQVLAPGWIALILLRNIGLVLLFYGAWHLPLYVKKFQGTQFKFNASWPPDNNRRFLFRSQNIDNVFWKLVGIPIWTVLEVGVLWCFANGLVPWMSQGSHPVLFCSLVPIDTDGAGSAFLCDSPTDPLATTL